MKNALILFALIFAQAASADVQNWEPVRILGYQADASGITFRVPSGGCTYKEDLKLVMNQEGDNAVELMLISRAKDECKAFFPYGVEMHFGYDEVGLPADIDFRIRNEPGVLHAAPECPVCEAARRD